MDTAQPIVEEDIIKGWKELTYSNHSIESMHCIKDSFKSSIWKITLASPEVNQPLILKIFKSLKRERKQNTVEKRMYRKANKVLHGLMPEIYHIQKRVMGHDMWFIMEHVKPLKEQVQFTPHHFDKIIPALAQLHGRTFNNRFHKHNKIFKDWLPQYEHRDLEKGRQKINKKTSIIIDTAMDRPDLYKLLRPSYKKLQKIIKKGPNYFPQLIEAGQSITHNDLQIPNMGCNNINERRWALKFIDWEGAQFAPCWFDMVNLVGVFFAYRTDWRKKEKALVRHCVELYVSEMKKQGIAFKIDPMLLYKMAYLQRILEKGLFLQLSWEISGRKKAYLLEGYLDKINRWGKELDVL